MKICILLSKVSLNTCGKHESLFIFDHVLWVFSDYLNLLATKVRTY